MRRRDPSIFVEIPGDKSPSLTRVLAAYNGSDADATRALYAELLHVCGPAGAVSCNLLRAQKTSARAKVYRGGDKGGSYRSQSYSTK